MIIQESKMRTKLIVLIIIIAMILCSSCGWVYQYDVRVKEIDIDEIKGYNDSNYYDPIRVDHCLVYAMIASYTNNNYAISIWVYPADENEIIVLNRVVLYDEDRSILEYDVNEQFIMEETKDGWEGFLIAGQFSSDMIDLTKGKQYKMKLIMEIGNGALTEQTELGLSMLVRERKMWNPGIRGW